MAILHTAGTATLQLSTQAGGDLPTDPHGPALLERHLLLVGSAVAAIPAMTSQAVAAEGEGGDEGKKKKKKKKEGAE